MNKLLSIKAIPSLKDNYIWLISLQDKLICVDPSTAEDVLQYLHQYHIPKLDEIWVTHEHADHIGGVSKLCHLFPQCIVRGHSEISVVNTPIFNESSFYENELLSMTPWFIPGHTQLHLLYLIEEKKEKQYFVFCGDTLFSAGCGRVFTGTVHDLFLSIQRINQLPETSYLYPAHEYTHSNLYFAGTIEPENQAIQQALQNTKIIPSLPVTLVHERAVNPFLRCNQPSVQKTVQHYYPQLSLPADEETIFTLLRQLKNQF